MGMHVKNETLTFIQPVWNSIIDKSSSPSFGNPGRAIASDFGPIVYVIFKHKN